MNEFTHLHNHTHYSLLDAACTPDQLIKAAVADEQKALALTDHGVMFGTIEFYNKSREAGLKPIIGFEAYVANGSRFDKSAGKTATKKKNYFHLILLAKNHVGYHNLLKLTTLAHTEGYYYKPRIDRELIERYHEGIIATSACIAGVVSAHLVEGDFEAARENAKFYHDVFGDDFYLELQDHLLPEDRIIMCETPIIAKELGIKLVATNDVHYEKREHAIAHNVLLYIKDVTKLDSDNIDINNLRYRTPELYFKTQKEMIDLFKDYPQAIESTLEIRDKCDLVFEKKFFMPVFPIPEESTAQNLDDYLLQLTEIGVNKRFKEITEEIRSRIDYELGVINSMGFSGYFLIVQDLIRAARELGVSVGPGRGSAAGSLVAYCLEITNVNPLPYNLLFERFLNPERVSMPDIDIDFSDESRERVIEYVKKKYGENSVSQIITFGKLSSRAVLKDVGRVLGIPHTMINTITAKIPVEQGKVKPLSVAFELQDLKWVQDSDDPKMKQLKEFSLLLEGFYRNSSLHAAGVVIAPGEVSDYVPLYQSPKEKTQGSELATQYSMNDLEQAGLLKMDFLGLCTLSIIDHTLEMIEKNHGVKLNIDDIDFNDEKTYDLISQGNTLAVFQFESRGMQDYLRQLRPRSLEELTAMNALYRPGPMENIPDFIDRKHGRKPITYLNPLMEKSLENTYGIIVYQEQVMQLVRDVAGFSLAGADNLRRAMGKKKQSVMDAAMPVFVEGAAKNGINEKDSTEIFELIKKFANYGFNKSHSLAYSYLAYQTAFLKANYPAEFLASNMTAEIHTQSKIVSLIEEAQKLGITVLPPDVNRSFATFTAADEKTILFGLAGIKNVGINAVDSIIRAREEKPFTTFYDFVARTDQKQINKRALEALVCAGAFDSFTVGHRAAYFAATETAQDYSKRVAQSQNTSMDDLFGGSAIVAPTEPHLPDIKEWNDKERLEKEKEYLNFYISGNPLHPYKPYIEAFSTLVLGENEEEFFGKQVRFCGMVSEIRTRLDKRQNTIAFVKVEDLKGRVECIFWSDAYSHFKDIVEPDAVLVFIGKLETDGDSVKIIIEQALTIDEAMQRYLCGYSLWVDIDKTTEDVLEKLQAACTDPAAKNIILFNLYNSINKVQKKYVAYNVSIPLSERVVARTVELFGLQSVQLLKK